MRSLKPCAHEASLRSRRQGAPGVSRSAFQPIGSRVTSAICHTSMVSPRQVDRLPVAVLDQPFQRFRRNRTRQLANTPVRQQDADDAIR